MHALFLKILNMSLAAGVLTAAVLLLRLALRRAPKWLRCLLWALVAVRLLCPWSLQSSLSAFSLLPAHTDAQGNLEYFRYNGNMEKSLLEFDLPRVAASEEKDSALGATAPETASPTVTVRAADRYLPPLEALWLAGVGAMLLYAAVSWLLLRRRVRFAVPLGGRLWLCDEVGSPFILGVFRPRIYLPAGLDGAAYEAVVAHERAHLARGDQLWKPLGFLLLAVHWFNPLLWLAWVLLCRDIELACDEKVVRDMEMNARADYSQALLDLSTGRRLVRVCPLAFGEGRVKARVKAVLHYKKPAFWIVLAAVLVCVALGVFFLTNPKSKAPAAEKTPWNWTSTVTAAGIKSCELSSGYTLSEAETASLVEKLNAVPKEAVYVGRGIPSDRVLDVTSGPGYRLRFERGIIELSFDDQKAAAALYEPGVWEIHDEALYEFLNDLWARSRHSISPEVQTVLREVLCTDGAQAEVSMNRLLSSLTEYPKETLETIGAYPEGVRQWLCWSLAAYIRSGVLADTDAPLSVEGLNADGQAARDLIYGHLGAPAMGEAPRSWQQAYQEFEASGQMGDYSAAALMDFDFDGVPELVVWHGGSVAGYAESDVSSTLLLFLRGGQATVYATDGTAVCPIAGGEYRTDAFLETPKSSTQPLSQTRRFLLLRDKETGEYSWWVHEGIDEDGAISGRFQPLSAPDEAALPYEGYGARQAAAASLLERYEPVALNYAAFTILHDAASDKNDFLRLINGWRWYDLLADPSMPTSVRVVDLLSSTFSPFDVERRDVVEKLWDLYQNMELSALKAEPTSEELRAGHQLNVVFKRGDATLAMFSIWGKYLAKTVQVSVDEYTYKFYEIRDGEAFYKEFLAVANSALPGA